MLQISKGSSGFYGQEKSKQKKKQPTASLSYDCTVCWGEQRARAAGGSLCRCSLMSQEEMSWKSFSYATKPCAGLKTLCILSSGTDPGGGRAAVSRLLGHSSGDQGSKVFLSLKTRFEPGSTLSRMSLLHMHREEYSSWKHSAALTNAHLQMIFFFFPKKFTRHFFPWLCHFLYFSLLSSPNLLPLFCLVYCDSVHALNDFCLAICLYSVYHNGFQSVST